MNAPTIVLLTDFGTDDPYVAEMKAAILATWARYPDAPPPPLVDLSHAVPPGDVVVAARWLARSAPRFPAGTVFVTVVDPGVGTDRPALALRADGRIHVGPGNGLFAGYAAAPDLSVVQLERRGYHLDGAIPSATFHGRDVFSPAAAHLAWGVPLAQLGPPADATALGTRQQDAPPSGALGRIVRIDRFGNAITDLRRDVAAGRALAEGAVLTVGGVEAHGPVASFGAAPPGELVWYWGSGDEVELALRDDSAARVHQLQVGMALTRAMP